MRNLIRMDNAKFGSASSIKSGRKVGGTKSRKKKKKEDDTVSGSKMAIFKQSLNANYIEIGNAINGSVLKEV